MKELLESLDRYLEMTYGEKQGLFTRVFGSIMLNYLTREIIGESIKTLSINESLQVATVASRRGNKKTVLRLTEKVLEQKESTCEQIIQAKTLQVLVGTTDASIRSFVSETERDGMQNPTSWVYLQAFKLGQPAYVEKKVLRRRSLWEKIRHDPAARKAFFLLFGPAPQYRTVSPWQKSRQMA